MTVNARPFFARGSVRSGALVLVAMAASLPGMAQTPQDSWDLCARRTAQVERAERLPVHLLSAISRVEPGRWHARSGAILAWPWIVTTGGEGRFLPNKKAAIAEVERLRARGVRHIDVGCMQRNLKHHGHAADSLEEALDPDRNIAYATRFLREIRARWGSWTRAVGNYHSNIPTLSGRYRVKVLRAVYAEKHRAAKARRAARLARLEAKRPAAPRPQVRGHLRPPNTALISR